MATDALFLDIWDDLLDALDGMSRANGDHFNYGGVVEDGDIDWDAAADLTEPPVFVAWRGESSQDPIYGGESATARFRHFEAVEVSVPIRDDEGLHSRKAFRVRQDIHKALMASTSRSRGTAGRAGTFETQATFEGNETGGLLRVVYHVRWDHVSGDMTTE